MTETSRLADQAIAAFNRRDWQPARDLALRALAQSPAQASGMHYIAGIACLELQQLAQAIPLLQHAVRLHPARADFAAQLAKALSIARLSREALAVADQAMALEPDDPLTLDTLGVVYNQANAYDRAAVAFRGAATRMPTAAHYRFNLATALLFDGDLAGAGQELEACIALAPNFWKAHLTLASLRRQDHESNHIERLRRLLEQAGSDQPAELYLNLALAKEYEDLGDYSAAFEHLARGKTAGRTTRNYSIRRDEVMVEALERAFPEPVTPDTGDTSEEPIFVLGMPRSGTTLIERILSSHPRVYSAGELQNFGVELKRLSGSRTSHMLDPDTIARGRFVDWRRLGQNYVASTRPATAARPRFVDKLPHNFLYAGFIARALPKASIVCLRRGPMDTCLSNFRQLFAQTSPYYDYSFDLLDTGRYYLLFDRLMAHWRRVLPGRIVEVEYEALVDDPESNTRRLLEHCGLPWHEGCLRFERNPAPVATASAVQVREPINRSSIGRWRKYAAELRPLQALLEEAGIAL